MNWKYFIAFPFIDTRINFISAVKKSGALLDIGSSDGQTLLHISEARPDLNLYATDIAGSPENYPAAAIFFRADIVNDKLELADETIDAVTCMHLVEHIPDMNNLFAECFRVLKAGGKIYIETPHPKTLVLSIPIESQAGHFTYNFFDDLTHIQIMPVGKIAAIARQNGFDVDRVGTSRNLLFAFLYLFSFLFDDRKKMITRVHFKGWSSYIVLKKN